jgi:hypothetical protein
MEFVARTGITSAYPGSFDASYIERAAP